MKTLSNLLKIFCIFVVIIIIGKPTTIYGQTNGKTSSSIIQNQDKTDSPVQKKVKENGDPIASYDLLEDFNPSENSLRKIRNDKHNIKDAAALNQRSAGILISGPFTHSVRKTALPTFESSYIVIGKITQKEAFLSTDKAAVYSEFSIKVEEVLKQDEEQVIGTSDTITGVRSGGKVRLPSGKLLHRANDGKPLPQVGKRYLLFLKYDKETNSSYILTGYELQTGKVVPLDGKGFEGETVQSYEDYQQYDGIEENCFLKIVRNVLSIN